MEALIELKRVEHPFNSTLETGIRAVVILEAFFPRQCDLIELTWLDHLVVHTSDLDGKDVPTSLHPDLPNRTAELLVRRPLVERSLRMMQQLHLVDVAETEQGVLFLASQDAPSYLDLLQSDYVFALKECARWIAGRFGSMSTAEIKAVVEAKIGRWTAEFRADQVSRELR